MRNLAGLLVAFALAACASAPTTSVDRPAAEAKGPLPPPRDVPAHDLSVPGTAVGVHGAVSSAEQNASAAGIDVLKRGGNAVDAAVAVAFALAVTHPSAGNLGGGGFMVVRMADGRTTSIDYRETAPAAATRSMYLDAKGKLTRDSVIGPRAAGIPGTVAGLALAHEKFGSLPWRELVQPAVRLATEGHTIDAHHASGMERAVRRMTDEGFPQSARYYSDDSGAPLREGALWQQPELGATLTLIADQGADGFYRGDFGSALAERVKALGGIWTPADLANYRAKERTPLEFDYRGYRVVTMPPPSAGGVVLRQMLVASELHDLQRYPFQSVEGLHLYIEAARRAYADRNYLLGDPDFADVPTAKLTARDYIEGRMRDIRPDRATPSHEVRPGVPPSRESTQTTHFSVVDDMGNAVSNTYTLNTAFGSKVVVPGTGILLNNEMDDFASKPGSANVYGLVQGESNAIQPGKRMLSSMTPTIVAKDRRLRAVVGTPGGPTITTTVFQILRGLLDYDMSLDAAVRAPRVHHQWLPDVVIAEEALDPATVAGLKELGHMVTPSRWGSIGHANCIEVDPATRGFRAVADFARNGGAALAY